MFWTGCLYADEEASDAHPAESRGPILAIERGHDLNEKKTLVSYVSLRVMTLDASTFSPTEVMLDTIPLEMCSVRNVFCRMVSRFTKTSIGQGIGKPEAMTFEWLSPCTPDEIFESPDFLDIVDVLDKTILAIEADKADANG